ncbi:MAG: hypothetical protein QOK39_1419 [Acidimicrobiaceae bacterium]|nr:hypothetical protein [Acidimicrobiaceae bacterium]
MTAIIEHLPIGVGLPRPLPGRMRPLRAGIRNIWEYDNQEFWFAEGRLILRGQNTAGKSKALELLLPFVLDGDIRSERLDPFGSQAKTMYWNLIDFADRPSAIGYCWLEFGQIDAEGAERFTTCIVGLRASRSAGRRVDTWFAVTPARVGSDLDLAPGDVPLTAERLRAALDERGVVSTSARDHRAAIDHALFGLGPDRYDALIHLLLQLRRPKLSEKLDMSSLGRHLSDALPPLERHRMESLASAFARLDDDTAEIERLEASAAQLHSFLTHYRSHAQIQTRLRADTVRSANTRFDKVTETERRQRAEHHDATTRLAAIELRRQELARAIERLTGQLGGLDLSKVHALKEVGKRAADAEAHAMALLNRAAEDRQRASEARASEMAARAEADEGEQRRVEQAAAALQAAQVALVEAEHRMHADQLRTDPNRAARALAGVADRRHQLLQAVRAASKTAEVARGRIRRCEEAHRRAESTLVDAEERENAGRAALDRAATAMAESVECWAGDWQVALPEGHADAAVEMVLRGARPGAGPLLAEARSQLADQRVALGSLRERSARRRDEADDERRRVAAETEDAPPPRPGRPASRPPGFQPLWACVDFDPALDDAARAALEAALEASGVLDALVSPTGQVLDSETLDTWITVSPGLADEGEFEPVATPAGWGGLVPVASAAVEEAAVTRALATLALGGVSVTLDGRWSNGSLRGRWSKPAAEYVGAGTRATARARRIVALTAEIDALDHRLSELAARETALAGELRRLDEAEAAWPSSDGLRDAGRDLDAAVKATGEARSDMARSSEHLDRARSDGQSAIDALATAETVARCDAAGLDDAFDAVSRYRSALGALAADAGHALTTAAAARSAAARADDDEARASVSEAQATDASARATIARGEADELQRTSGADADEVLARHRELSASLDAAATEQKQLGHDRDTARDRLASAAALLATTEEERGLREAERSDALSALARLAATELASLAVGPVDPDRDLTQVTAGLAFARAAHDRLRDVSVDQAAQDSVSNLFHNGMSTLRSQLGTDFDPYLDTSDGLEVCFATLNGAPVGATELSTALDDQIRRRRQTLTAEERELIERHLLTEVGTHLGERVHAAWALKNRMNEQLSAHPTRGGVTLRLSWEVDPAAGTGAEEAVRLLRQDVRVLHQPERAALAAFLAERVRAAREDSEGADVVERLAGALDYRRWHRFSIHRRSHGQDERLTARTQGFGSGGEQAKLAHLPLFAATAAYYASARPDAPHLLMLDEAFAGIDDSQRGDCMGMLVSLDLDMVLTNYAEWGCYPEVPAVAIYHLERTPGRHGVTALRFVWDGHARREDDPWLDRNLPPSALGKRDFDDDTLLA